jgi:hypothetical protein
MPLPSILKGAKQCQVMTKRSKSRCKNPCAYGSEKACRMHGSHRSRNVPRGPSHTQYKNGEETKEAKAERSEKREATAISLKPRTLGYLQHFGASPPIKSGKLLADAISALMGNR